MRYFIFGAFSTVRDVHTIMMFMVYQLLLGYILISKFNFIRHLFDFFNLKCILVKSKQ